MKNVWSRGVFIVRAVRGIRWGSNLLWLLLYAVFLIVALVDIGDNFSTVGARLRNPMFLTMVIDLIITMTLHLLWIGITVLAAGLSWKKTASGKGVDGQDILKVGMVYLYGIVMGMLHAFFMILYIIYISALSESFSAEWYYGIIAAALLSVYILGECILNAVYGYLVSSADEPF